QGEPVIRLAPGWFGRPGEEDQLVPITGLAADTVDRLTPGGGRQPGGGVGRYAARRPGLDGAQDRFLDQLLGEVEVAQKANEPTDQPACLLPKDASQRRVGRRTQVGNRCHMWSLSATR